MIFKKILVIFYDFFKYFKGNLNNFFGDFWISKMVDFNKINVFS